MPKRVYEIRLRGAIGPAARQAFRDLSVEVEPSTTVLTAELDSAELHGVLDRMRDLALELVEIRHQGFPQLREGPATDKGDKACRG